MAEKYRGRQFRRFADGLRLSAEASATRRRRPCFGRMRQRRRSASGGDAPFARSGCKPARVQRPVHVRLDRLDRGKGLVLQDEAALELGELADEDHGRVTPVVWRSGQSDFTSSLHSGIDPVERWAGRRRGLCRLCVVESEGLAARLQILSPTSPVVDVSACGARGGSRESSLHTAWFNSAHAWVTRADSERCPGRLRGRAGADAGSVAGELDVAEHLQPVGMGAAVE